MLHMAVANFLRQLLNLQLLMNNKQVALGLKIILWAIWSALAQLADQKSTPKNLGGKHIKEKARNRCTKEKHRFLAHFRS